MPSYQATLQEAAYEKEVLSQNTQADEWAQHNVKMVVCVVEALRHQKQ